MLDVVAVALHDGRTSAKAYHEHAVELGFVACAETVSHKLLCLFRRQSVDRFVDIGAAHSSKHYLLHLVQLYVVVVEILAESSI